MRNDETMDRDQAAATAEQARETWTTPKFERIPLNEAMFGTSGKSTLSDSSTLYS
ncbi:MAG: hypothetical protein ACLQVD_22035 [Capsulimonadaceae bacterium]